MYRIYKYTSPDGKVYIGCTTQTIEARAGIAGHGYAGCTRFWEAIKQLGWENFTCEVLEEVEDAELAALLEIEYILRYEATDPEKGYNSIKQSLARYWTEERREEWSELLKEKFQDPEIRRHISEGTKAGIAARGDAARVKASKNRWADPEYKSRVRASMKTAANTPEHRAKMSAVGIEAQNRPEVKAKLSASFTGLIFINNGEVSKRVTEDEAQRLIASGEWKRGRMKPGKGSRGPIKALQNRKWVHEGGESKFVPEAEYQSYLNQGWKPGRK